MSWELVTIDTLAMAVTPAKWPKGVGPDNLRVGTVRHSQRSGKWRGRYWAGLLRGG